MGQAELEHEVGIVAAAFVAKNEIFSNDFPKYFRISGILQHHDSSSNNNNSGNTGSNNNTANTGNNVSGKMKSREIFTTRLDFFPCR